MNINEMIYRLPRPKQTLQIKFWVNWRRENVKEKPTKRQKQQQQQQKSLKQPVAIIKTGTSTLPGGIWFAHKPD